MRSFIPMLILGVPAVALGASTCPAAAPVHAPGGAPPSQPAPVIPEMGPTLPAADIAASPALTRLASQGAQLYRLESEHGLEAIFARSGTQFRVFYLTPDHLAEIGGVMWDATGHNVTRDQVSSIPGAIPTVQWNPSASGQGSRPGTASTATAPLMTDPVERVKAVAFGLEGQDTAPRVYMFIDPLCPFSTRAYAALKPAVASGRLQLAIVPVSINDHENSGASTPAAQQMLSAQPHDMAALWSQIDELGHAVPGHATLDTAGASLMLNLSAAHSIGLRGTPTFVWKDRNGIPHVEAGLPDDVEAFLASLHA
ncbi:MAG: DsbC family protein [Acetobacter aceti]|uniref:DsbC family protein n=1 Tax=Gluconobacter TaxID=441 RepID=UPI001B8B2E45|nr:MULTISPECIES: DsbC family protein [Gluconobacter]MBS1023042.1 DsbC family protein [Gluconobacter cerinus]MBS1025447.1 DsbC family protein [Gluconobacter cerinus]MBS1054703.1 DsbC family protein [Gluconobacter kondonii]